MEPSTIATANTSPPAPTPPHTATGIADRIAFARFVGFLERLANAAGQPKKVQLLKTYYASFCDFQRTFTAPPAGQRSSSSASDCSFFAVLRLLVPSLDNERPACGIRTTTMGKLLVRILAVDRRSEVAQRLMRPYDEGPVGGAGGNGAGDGGGRRPGQRRQDYADVVYEAMRQRGAGGAGEKAGVLTVAAVNGGLDRIARYYQENRRECE